MKKILFLAVVLSGMIHADSLNSPLKNPSVGVTGTPRETTPIVATVYPFAQYGQQCNSNTDTVAITTDHRMMLLCHNNVWMISAVVQEQ